MRSAGPLLSPVETGFAPEPTGVGLAEKLTAPVGGELVRDEGIGVEHGDAFRCLVVCFEAVAVTMGRDNWIPAAGLADRRGGAGVPIRCWLAGRPRVGCDHRLVRPFRERRAARRQPRTRVAARARAGTPAGLLQVMLIGVLLPFARSRGCVGTDAYRPTVIRATEYS